MPRSVVALERSPEYRSIVESLVGSGNAYRVEVAEDYDALLRSLDPDPAIVVVDFGDVPDREEGLVRLRRRTGAPILALVADEEESRSALRGGADYHLPKPFDPEVFGVAVEAAVLGSGSTAPLAAAPPLTVAGLRVLPDRRTVEREGRRQSLSQREWQLFAFLLAHPGRVLSRRELAAGAWGPGYTARAGEAELYVSRVRRKVERDPRRPSLIETVRGRGYRLNPAAE